MMKSNFLNIFLRILILLLFFFVIFGSFQKVSADGFYDKYGKVDDLPAGTKGASSGGNTDEKLVG